MFTRLLDSNNEDITLFLLFKIFKTKLALLLPFFTFAIILGFEVAVNAVSDPDKKPDNITKRINKMNRVIVIYDIKFNK